MFDPRLPAPVTIASPLGPLSLGVVDASWPGVAEGVSKLLNRSIQDARAETGGHLPSWLVDDIQRNYISPEKVRTLWAGTGHRFVLVLAGAIVGTIHISKSPRMILTVDRNRNNVDEADHPGFKPPNHHHVVNISVKHELRRARLGTRMVEGICTHFRSLFSGDGLWVRADPPWHTWLSGLGFEHDPRLDVFLPESVERTSGLPHPEFNRRYACACEPRRPELDSMKLQYVSMTRPFARAARSSAGAAPGRAIEALAAELREASRTGQRVAIRGRGQSYFMLPNDASRVVSTEQVPAGQTWRTLLESGARPPVSPTWLEASVGGVLATGGIGHESATRGLAIDHVARLVVVTGDGRIVECTRTQARWLFDAVLGGGGEFGVIAEATFAGTGDEVALRPPRVAPKTMVHAILPRASVDAFATFAAPARVAVHPIADNAERPGLFFPRVADACSVSVMGDTLDPEALIAKARSLGGAPTIQNRITDWRAFLGDRYDDAVRAKRMADPAGILGRFRAS